MKKTIFLLFIIFIIYMFIGNMFAEAEVIIPNDAIRVRVIPNSNSNYDIDIKNKVKDEIEENLENIMENANTIDEARIIIKDNIDDIDEKVFNLLKKEKYEKKYRINYGLNYFPQKEYKDVIYNEGYYESLVVTLGDGLGDNWWCVLFPPLCLLEAEESEEVSYKSYVKEMIDKYF